MSDFAIQVDNLSFSYMPGGKKILDNISISIKKGEFVAFLGDNGSGKSSLVKHFNALLLPSQGSVTIAGLNPLEDENIIKIRQKAGMVFQNPDNQIVAALVEDDVAFTLENLGIESSEIRRRVDAALKSVDLFEHRDKEPHLLSGGQKQRLAIASMVAMSPEIMIFDEPTAMLDPAGQKEVINLVKQFCRQGKTIIYVTHHIAEVLEADRIVYLREGTICLDTDPDNFFQNPDLYKKFTIEIPLMVKISKKLNKKLKHNFPLTVSAGEILKELKSVNRSK
jgi:energy-coupling factor transport system ATP-binding protein